MIKTRFVNFSISKEHKKKGRCDVTLPFSFFHWHNIFLFFFFIFSLFFTKNLSAQTKISIDLFGLNPVFSIPKTISEVDINRAFFYENAADAVRKNVPKFQPLAQSINTFSAKYRLNDWLKLQLAYQIISKIYPEASVQKLSLMLLLRSMNYNSLIIQTGKENDAQFNVAVEINHPLYNSVVFNHDEKLFGVINLATGSFFSSLEKNKLGYFVDISKELAEEKNSMNIRPTFYPKLPFKKTIRLRTWKFENKTYKLSFTLNKNLVAYFKSYPQIKMGYYFSHPINQSLVRAVIVPLKQTIQKEKMDEKKAVEFLLAFCHHAFEHSDDRETKRGEHHNFVEETLYDKTSDCEDKSVLLAALIRAILGYDVIGLEYPEHISLAVNIPNQKVPGVGYKYQGKLYMEADPSFIGCSLGDTQPELQNENPNVIPIGKLKIVD